MIFITFWVMVACGAESGKTLHVYLLRHGESEYNAGNITKLDAELTEKGKERASNVTGHFNVVICSTLTRARQTLHGSQITWDQLIMSEDVRERRIANCDFFEHEVDTGLGKETEKEFEARMERAKRLIQTLSEKNNKILIVGHRVFFRSLISKHSRTPFRGKFDNAKMIKFPFVFKR